MDYARAIRDMLEELRGAGVDGGSLTLMEGESVAGETPADLVKSAWDFQAIGKAWLELAAHLDLAADLSISANPAHLAAWMTDDRRMVRHCTRTDPLLPAVLLPKDYPGRKIWRQRGRLFAKLAALINRDG